MLRGGEPSEELVQLHFLMLRHLRPSTKCVARAAAAKADCAPPQSPRHRLEAWEAALWRVLRRERREYAALALEDRVTALKELCEAALESDTLRAIIEPEQGPVLVRRRSPAPRTHARTHARDRPRTAQRGTPTHTASDGTNFWLFGTVQRARRCAVCS